ncbi:unnamed protein product [Amoebophrya sp. A25]|nr:unnamed protein product [Amoebophrya sp. A25]|eukprot:GSA25T00007016001.1
MREAVGSRANINDHKSWLFFHLLELPPSGFCLTQPLSAYLLVLRTLRTLTFSFAHLAE